MTAMHTDVIMTRAAGPIRSDPIRSDPIPQLDFEFDAASRYVT